MMKSLTSRSIGLLFGILVLTNTCHATEEPPWERGELTPAWATADVARDLTFKYQSRNDPESNGRRLAEAIRNLQPGDRLKIDSGVYQFAPKLVLNLQGTADKPIRIEAADAERPPVLKRDERQNLLNLGEGEPCRYLLLRGLEMSGGSVGIRFHDTAHVWLDECHIHNAAHGGLTTNTRNTHHLFITDNHLHNFQRGTGEAMYLGANHGKVVMRDSVIAGNHVHDCGGSQGDGIEVKQGSFRNWIVGNEVHDTQYPCILVYGTDGKGINRIERNICYRSGDNVLQIQGEAEVYNNLIMAGEGAGFSSTDHQGKTKDLRFIHNTIITSGTGANLSSWDDRTNMVFANNAVYSRNGTPIRFPGGRKGVFLTGNVILRKQQGNLPGVVEGRGLSDFKNVDWNAKQRIAVPAVNSMLLGAGDSKFQLATDLRQQERRRPVVAGAFTLPVD